MLIKICGQGHFDGSVKFLLTIILAKEEKDKHETLVINCKTQSSKHLGNAACVCSET